MTNHFDTTNPMKENCCSTAVDSTESSQDCCHTEDNSAACSEETQETEACPCCCSGKHKTREEKEYRDLMNRLKRIEGQVRGVEGMLENDVYCTDILVQVSAITSALNSFNKALLANHMRTCVADNIRKGNDDVIDELVTTLQKLMK